MAGAQVIIFNLRGKESQYWRWIWMRQLEIQEAQLKL
jgi:hypothetical protein